MDKLFELSQYWQTTVKDPWCDGNEDIFRCLVMQFDELEQWCYVPEDAVFAMKWRENLADSIYHMILGGYNAEGSSEGFEE
jgi:hypothetical protein